MGDAVALYVGMTLSLIMYIWVPIASVLCLLINLLCYLLTPAVEKAQNRRLIINIVISLTVFVIDMLLILLFEKIASWGVELKYVPILIFEFMYIYYKVTNGVIILLLAFVLYWLFMDYRPIEKFNGFQRQAIHGGRRRREHGGKFMRIIAISGMIVVSVVLVIVSFLIYKSFWEMILTENLPWQK